MPETRHTKVIECSQKIDEEFTNGMVS